MSPLAKCDIMDSKTDRKGESYAAGIFGGR